MLTGCSSGPRPEISITTAPLIIFQPVRPRPVQLYDEQWRKCEQGQMVCLTPNDAKKTVRNKVTIGRWMSEMNGIVTYYESVTSPAAPSSQK